MNKKVISQIILLIFLFLTSFVSKAGDLTTNKFPAIWRTYPFYMDISLDYRSTDWSQLVATGPRWIFPHLPFLRRLVPALEVFSADL